MQNITYLKLLNSIIKEDSLGVEEIFKSEEMDLDNFNKFIWENQLSGILYSILSNSKLGSFFPDTFVPQFKPSYLKQWIHNEKLVREIEVLSNLFNVAGEEVIFLKGPFLAQRFYGNIDRRAIADIDFLVKKEQIDGIELLLEKNGYMRKSIILPNKSLSIYFTHHFEYVRDEIALELHWTLSTHFTFRIDYQRIWLQKKKYEFRKKSYWVLSDEYELVLQMLSIFKDTELGTITLKSFLDAYMILKTIGNCINWDEFFADRKKEGIYQISINTLDLVLSLLNCRDEFQKLSSYIEESLVFIKYKNFDDKLNLLNRSRLAIQNKLWTFGLYSTNPLNSFFWWAISLPFRLTTYRESSSNLLRRWKI
jgi:hypothetical protein